MKKSIILGSLTALVVALPLAFVGCGADDNEGNSNNLIAEVIDSVAEAVAENVVDSQPAVDEPLPSEVPAEPMLAVDLAARENHIETGLPPINDVRIEDQLVYAGFDGGLLIYDLKTRKFSVTPIEENLEVIERHGGERFVGGDNLYQIDSAGLLALEEEIPGQITSLCSFGPSLMIGATTGLYVQNLLGCANLLEDIEVSALVSDGDGLWIGTAGDGLFRWDGVRYRQRFLSRDPDLFDHVTALDYNHQHLYVGTTNGMYVYDGGRWETITVETGLPGNEVTAIDATGWVVRIGTTSGMATYFEDEVKPLDKLAGYTITTIGISQGRIIAGTARQGLVMKNGPAVQVLVEPWMTQGEELAQMIH